jgi:hypothetical protein
MARKRVSATVKVWHANGTSAPMQTDDGDMIGDISSLDITLYGLAWAHGVRIDVDPKSGEITVSVLPADENSPTLPQLKVLPDLSITART